MPAPVDEPLSRCNLLLYEKDKQWLFRRYGQGQWSAVVRRLVREHIRETEKPKEIVWPITK